MMATTVAAPISSAVIGHLDWAVPSPLGRLGAGAESGTAVERFGTLGNASPVSVDGDSRRTGIPSELTASPVPAGCAAFDFTSSSGLAVDCDGCEGITVAFCAIAGERVNATVRIDETTKDNFGCPDFISVLLLSLRVRPFTNRVSDAQDVVHLLFLFGRRLASAIGVN
jgi:hypothetical protein